MSQTSQAASIVAPPRASANNDRKHSFSPSLVMATDPSGAAAEAIRTLRTHILAQHLSAGRRALAVCTPSKEAGCTFVAANLAVAFSQAGLKTLLIDGDLRAPSVHEMIRPARLNEGLRRCLTGATNQFHECIEPEVLPNLSVIFSGGPAPNAQELLSSDRFQELMGFCMREYDLTVVDTPPANVCSDARRIGTVCGYSIIVARRDKTLVDDVKTLSIQLRGDQSSVIGTVLNEA
jgi:protein-tyrosine kinase